MALGKLDRANLPVAPGVVVTPPNLKLRTTLEHYDFKSKEVFEQSLILVKKEIEKIPVPETLARELKDHSHFLFNGEKVSSIKGLWLKLLFIWLTAIKDRLFRDGFYQGITEELESQLVIFVKKIEAFGTIFLDPMTDEMTTHIKKGKLHPNDQKRLDEILRVANKKLFIPHQYEWINDRGVKLSKVLPYTPSVGSLVTETLLDKKEADKKANSTVKIFLDLSAGLIIEREADGVYLASEKIFDLNKVQDSFENLVFRLVESAAAFEESQILFKLADLSEGMGKLRGTLRLLHQKSLLDPLIEALDFVRNKKNLTNVHLVIPFVRGVGELLQIKRQLSLNKLKRQVSLQFWMEIAVPENMVNLEDYLMVGIDGAVINLDELIAHIVGFDQAQQELMFYKNEVSGMLKFLEDGVKVLNKSKVPFIAYGSLSLYPEVLDFLVERGVFGMVVERYEVPSAKDLLYQAEKRMILRKSS